jgi:YbbR domain-containing protein
MLRREHLTSLMIALVLSFIVWLSAISRERPLATLTLPRPDSEQRISVEFRGLPEGRSWYLPDQRSIKVDVLGKSEPGSLDAISAVDVEAWVDLSSIGPDATNFTGPVQVRCRRPVTCLRRGIRIVSSKPDKIGVRVGPTLTATHEIQVVSDASTPAGTNLASRLVGSRLARIQGAERQVARVARVEAQVAGVEGLRNRIRVKSLPLRAVDEFGREVEDVSIEPGVVEVDLSILRQGEPIYLLAGYEGSPAEGYRVVGFEIEPQPVQLAGPRELIDPLRNSLSVSVDIEGITEDLIVRQPLDLPEGVEALNAADGVTLTVRVKALQGTRSIDLPLSLEGAEPGLISSLNPERVRVLVGGAQPLLDNLDLEAIQASVDLGGLSAGRHRVGVRLSLPDGVREISITPAQVEVSLSRDGLSQSSGRGNFRPAFTSALN